MKSFLNTSWAKEAIKIHCRVPADWYTKSVKENLFQRYWHNQRFNQIKKISLNLKGVFLDIGCADGFFSKFILDNSEADKIYGLDVLEKSITFAQKKYKKINKLKFLTGEAHHLPFKEKTFDAVFCLEVLEHIKDPSIVIKDICRVLKNDGELILIVPKETLPFKFIWFFWTKFRGKIWMGTHVNNFSKENKNLINMVKKENFRIKTNISFLFGMLQLIEARIDRK